MFDYTGSPIHLGKNNMICGNKIQRNNTKKTKGKKGIIPLVISSMDKSSVREATQMEKAKGGVAPPAITLRQETEANQ